MVPEDIAKYNLILYGTDETNSIVADILPELPVRFRDETIVFAGKSYSGENVGMQMVYPNPSNRDRYIVLRATPGSAGLGKFGLDRRAVPDFIIVDATLRYPDQSKTLTAGLFNDRWELDETSE